jgi:hypothetical protein
MDRDDVIEQLTAQLRNVTIRLAQLEAAADQRGDSVSSARTAAASVEQGNVESSAKKAAAPTNQEGIESSAKRAAAPILQKGDRVYITNTVKEPQFWNGVWEQGKAQKATVTHFYKGQIHFVTDNGIRTWRAVNNLRRLEE